MDKFKPLQTSPKGGEVGKYLLTVDQTARFLGIGRTKVYALIKAGELPVVRLGGSVRIHAGKLQAKLDSLVEGVE